MKIKTIKQLPVLTTILLTTACGGGGGNGGSSPTPTTTNPPSTNNPPTTNEPPVDNSGGLIDNLIEFNTQTPILDIEQGRDYLVQPQRDSSSYQCNTHFDREIFFNNNYTFNTPQFTSRQTLTLEDIENIGEVFRFNTDNYIGEENNPFVLGERYSVKIKCFDPNSNREYNSKILGYFTLE